MDHTRRMRIYVPVTMADLQHPDGISARTGFAVTEEVRAMAPDEDDEGLEYMVFLAAADAAIDEGETTRIVVAADGPARATGHAGVVEVGDVPWRDVVSIHIDDVGDPHLLADIALAQAEDAGARERVKAADLMWYDASERDEVVSLIAAI